MHQPAASSPPSLTPVPVPVTALAIVNARVWTGDPRRPWADAVLVRGERIELVGSSAEVRKRAGSARIVDARGMMLSSIEKDVGTLAPGMLADFALIDRDLTRITPDTIRDGTVVLTIMGGRVVYDRDGLTR